MALVVQLGQTPKKHLRTSPKVKNGYKNIILCSAAVPLRTEGNTGQAFRWKRVMQEPLSRGRETAGRTPGMKEDHYRGLWEYKTPSSLPFWPLGVYIGYIWKSNIQFELLSDSIIKIIRSPSKRNMHLFSKNEKTMNTITMMMMMMAVY